MYAVRRTIITVLVSAGLILATAAPALAYAPVGIVHTEQVVAGPYRMTLGFSVWPLHAMQSLDFTFIPDGGITGKSGSLTVDGPGIPPGDNTLPLARHPRKLDVWGLDVQSLDAPGRYTFGFRIDGPQGPAQGTSAPITVLDQPGPPTGLSWAVCAIPLAGLIVFLAVSWRRARPSRDLTPMSAES